MGETSIQWTDRTWNPVRGCSRVSRGCENCYAERIAARFAPGSEYEPGFEKKPFTGFAVMKNGEPHWTGKVALVPEKLDEPLHWRKPCRVFVNSMSDLFHEKLSDEDIDPVFAVMAASYWHTFQVLTKRPGRMRAYLRGRREPGTSSPASLVWRAVLRSRAAMCTPRASAGPTPTSGSASRSRIRPRPTSASRSCSRRRLR